MGLSSASRRLNGVVVDDNGPLRGPSSSTIGRNQGLVLKNKLRALVVDDNRITRSAHALLLRNHGVETLEVENGRRATNLCLDGADFDIIIMEMEVPILDGHLATRLIRAMGIPTMILGVHANSRRRETFMKAGIDAFYVKPISHIDLIPILREIDNDKI
ncbi:hypothetical protein MRB53_028477 [Persea americana]|uniref:Uncharacterized protein n=1 Tax=Persea americana TaxID=3435 RepID=A0ACC2KGA2_PERAE|nr:hypothetical protein MRB53_028477 [Persea americana]